ncbi:WD40 repeat domain-containing protein [Fimbriiglobus ruber]|uniref:High-affnity carbon uptake protein Hat/HatR n=1 Tax=Fimbriiglobus ruber TaxID=1908690 RepID=A0A225DMX3_9BACT|nr:PQQ-binding-like beta-propeller repeat protein [Fimbriiglobus ruber]OWK38589.1 High-affnity carbon uptake protein Hat/HatR [Fimbriiglobus ruber]
MIAPTPKEHGPALTPPAQVTRLRFSPCGTQLTAACIDGVVRRWNITGAIPAELASLKGHGGWVSTLAYLPNNRLVTADTFGRLSAWDYTANDPKPLWTREKAHDGWLRAVAVSLDAKTLATTGRDSVVRLWSPDGTRQREIPLGVDTFSLAFHPDGKTLVAGDLFGTLHALDPATGKTIRTIAVKELHLLDRIQDVGGVRCLVFSPDGKTLFAAGCQPKTGGFVQGFPLLVSLDWATSQRGPQWKGASDNEGFIHDLLWHPGRFLVGVTSGQPGNGKLFFWTPGEEKPSFVSTKLPNCHSVDLHPGGERLTVAGTNATSSGNGRVKAKDGAYPANTSPIQFWDVPKA